MKTFRFSKLWAIAVICCLFSCRFHHGNTDITLSESHRYFTMEAYFPKNKTRKVQQYMDEQIGNRSNTSFVNANIDGTISLDDKTNFYIKLQRGQLNIKLDKETNSVDSYKRIKQMCEGIKKEISKD